MREDVVSLTRSFRCAVRSCTLALALIAAAFPASAQVGQRISTLGTGNTVGFYFPIGGALAGLVGEETDGRVRIVVESTSGSMENIVRVVVGDLSLGVAQSDRVSDAFLGLGSFEREGPARSLRTIMALHAEPVTVLVRADSDITRLEDLWGRRVNLGPRNHPIRRLLTIVFDGYGWPSEDAFEALQSISYADQAEALCEDRTDAIAYVAAYPSGSVYGAASLCEMRVLPLSGPSADRVLADNGALQPVTIPAGLYPGVSSATPTLGPVAVLITTADANEETVTSIVTTVLDRFERFRDLHPALEGVTVEGLVDAQSVVPLHPAARAVYEARGLLATGE